MASNSRILGVVLLIRHGDRQGFYQDPTDYTPSNTAITPLGNQEEFQLGQQLRSIYFNASSPSFISTVNSTIVDNAQVELRADGTPGEGGVIVNSAISLVQGLFPATLNYTVLLANGSTIEGPLGGYQTVPIEAVDDSISLEGWALCNTFNTATEDFYNSALFQKMAAENADFLNQLPQYLDGRPVTLENMWNIYDFMNVQSTYNASFAQALPPTFLAQARYLANFHEYGVFSSPQLNGIGNIAGQTILPSIIDGFTHIVNASDPLKFVYQSVSYKPLLSLFNMTGVAQTNPDLTGFVNYAGAVAFEVRQPDTGGEPVIRFNFQNGTGDEFRTYNILNSTSDVSLSTFVHYFQPVAFDDLPTWCKVCNNSVDRGCANLIALNTSMSGMHQRISPVGAGFLGAGLTVAVVLAMFAVLSFLGLLTFGKRRNGATSLISDHDSDSYEKK